MNEPSSSSPARVRPSYTAALQPFTVHGSVLQDEDIPRRTYDSDGACTWGAPYQRAAWIAERMALGMWHGDDSRKCADAWGVSTSTADLDVTVASRHLQMLTGDIQRLEQATAMRISNMAADRSLDPALQLKAGEVFLKLTGALKGGRETPSMTESEREKAIVEWIRDPDEQTVRLLREAFGAASDTLRALLAEFAVVMTEGDER